MSELRSTEIASNDEGFKMTRCGSCHAPIIWTEMLYGGKRMPLDATPNPQGTVAIEDRGQGRYIAQVFSGNNLSSVRMRGAPTLYMSHFATCPNAAEHRR